MKRWRAVVYPVLVLAVAAYLWYGKEKFEECLADFSWWSVGGVRRVVLEHAVLPVLPVYLDILAGAVADWRAGGGLELVVIFPPDAREAVEAALG